MCCHSNLTMETTSALPSRAHEKRVHLFLFSHTNSTLIQRLPVSGGQFVVIVLKKKVTLRIKDILVSTETRAEQINRI